MNNVFEMKQVSKSYKQGDKTINVINNCNFVLPDGQNAAIIGRSGSGKSTILHLLSAMEAPSSGSIIFNKSNLCSPNNLISVIFQKHYLQKEFTAKENVSITAQLRGASKKIADSKAIELLSSVGLNERLDHTPSMMSGGECARVAIARSLVGYPKCILADEPTGNLDFQTKDEIMSLLIDHAKARNCALVLVTHDESLLKEFDAVYKIKDGIVRFA